ncbi:MAG: TonB-dependent receptor [Acidobacteria bacterium]|nr:TonB-dependent receptor [Acidobacteriota bacterium]
MKWFALLAAVVLWPLAGYSGEIQGKVLNAQGAAVGGATVTANADQDGSIGKAVTQADGSYVITGLSPGIFTVTATTPGNSQQVLRQTVSLRTVAARADFRLPAAPAPQLSGAEERNPNIFIYRIDLNDLRNRLTLVRGPDPTYIPEFRPALNYFGAEFGTPILGFESLRPRSPLSRWHGVLSALHQNSALNARNFFNVGPLLGSRLTSYNISAEGPLNKRTALLLNFGQTYNSGFVNGNAQVPFAHERTPRSSNPQVNAIIGDLLQAFPAAFPNLPNVSLRQLNSNAPREIYSSDGLARVDFKVSDKTLVAMRYFMNDYNEDPFQIVLGQNPHTELRFQGVYTNVTHIFSPRATARFGFHYDRAKADLDVTRQYSDLFRSLGLPTVPDVVFRSGTLGVSASVGLGPGKQFPRFRVQNRFQYYADLTKTVGRHTFTVGGSFARVQVNDLQSDNGRGVISFSVDTFPGDAGPVDEVTNFLRGQPSTFTVAFGNLYRGFRNSEYNVYAGDQIRVTPALSVSAGLRYELMTIPKEVNRLTDVQIPTDKNNFAPRFGFAWNPGRGKTTVRGTYGISYSTVFPVAYGMTRFNPPGVGTTQLVQPGLLDVLNLLRAAPTQPLIAGARSSLYRFAPGFVFPYSHQYSFGIERALPGNMTLTLAYMGTRSFHVFSQQVYNRPDPDPRPECSPAILNRTCNTTADINRRRPDPRYFDINEIASESNAYYDAVQVSLAKRISRGLTFRAAYTFSKNIDLGGDFTNTGSGVETPPETGTNTCEHCDRVSDQKGRSLFDTPHAFLLTFNYTLPALVKGNAWVSAVSKGWQVSGTGIIQSGTVWHLHTGSDGPGFGNVDGNTQDRPNILNPSLIGKAFDNPDTAPELMGVGTCVRPSVPGPENLDAKPYMVCKNFDTNIPVSGRGNLGSNTFRKDATKNWNVALGRTFRLPGNGERALQFRSEFYNLFNSPQFDKPGVQLASETFGQITNTVNKGRQVQFSLKLLF